MTKLRIYQINIDKDKNAVVFESYENHLRIQKTDHLNTDLYDNIFECDIIAKNLKLEDIFCIFNVSKPSEYKGRSLSVSDVVEIIKSDDIAPGFYYCDPIGWKKIPFSAIS